MKLALCALVVLVPLLAGIKADRGDVKINADDHLTRVMLDGGGRRGGDRRDRRTDAHGRYLDSPIIPAIGY